MQLRLADAESTESLGRLLAITRTSQAVVHLQGDLGAVKSTLARAPVSYTNIEVYNRKQRACTE